MIKKNILSLSLFAINIIVLAVFIYWYSNNQNKVVVVDSIKIFEAFEMKKDFDFKLESDLSSEKLKIDSITNLMKLDSDNIFYKKQYRQITQQFNSKFDVLSKKYTYEVYKKLNNYLKEFGIERKYDLILGSNGQGNIIYLDKSKDITDEVIKYINEKYSK